jgi:hypothetical protein
MSNTLERAERDFAEYDHYLKLDPQAVRAWNWGKHVMKLGDRKDTDIMAIDDFRESLELALGELGAEIILKDSSVIPTTGDLERLQASNEQELVATKTLYYKVIQLLKACLAESSASDALENSETSRFPKGDVPLIMEYVQNHFLGTQLADSLHKLQEKFSGVKVVGDDDPMKH